MKNNMGVIDRCIRFVIAFVFIILFAKNIVPSPWDIIILVIAGLFIITSLLGFCPIYLLFKIDTRSHEKKKESQNE
jgi:hypothetical protein